MKNFLTKNWIHIAALAFMVIVTMIYFKPQLEGNLVRQHDVEQWKGMAQEAITYRENTGVEQLWTNSMFGGMPTMQISLKYGGNMMKTLLDTYVAIANGPIGITLLHMLGFYVLALFLGINPIVGLIGSVALSFASYEIIIIQAGHQTKAFATAFMAPVLGAFIYAYKSNKKLLGIALTGFFITIELVCNHVQVAYYLFMLLGMVGIYFLYDAIIKKQVKSFLITTAGLIGVVALAFAINSGNILLTNDYAKHTIRGGNDITINVDGTEATNQSAGLDKDYITQWSYGIGESFTLISPNVKGGGSFAIKDSQFEEIVENADVSKNVMRYGAYWGEQPFTSGPVYIGVVVALLAFLGLFFIQSKIKWALFAMTMLALMLSWGKNFMGLTEFFIDYVPAYDKFRTVTIILVIVELTVPVLGVMFLDLLIKEKENFKAKKNLLFGAVGGFILFLMVVKFVGLGDGYMSSQDESQLAKVEESIYGQLINMDPEVLRTQYNLDINNQQNVEQFISAQMEQYEKDFDDLKIAREAIFQSSMNRSIGFAFIAGLMIVAFLFVSIPGIALAGGLLLLVMIDMIPVAHDYLGDQEIGSGYKYWEEAGEFDYPIAANAADLQILAQESALNPTVEAKVGEAESKAKSEANTMELSNAAKNNYINSKKFAALNELTNYRVFDLNGGFQSSRPSYYHKSLGGYHGAKLRNINNLMDFHLSVMNNKVYDMMNVKYFLQQGEQGYMLRPNVTAMGNAWLVKSIETHETPNDEIRALGNEFTIKNVGPGTFMVNQNSEKETHVFGREKLQYLVANQDTAEIRMPNDLPIGMVAYFVMDVNGKTSFIPKQTLDLDTTKGSFLKLVEVTVSNSFQPREEAVMLKSEAEKLNKSSFTGEGTVTMDTYSPMQLTYTAEVKGDQFAVFSEVYYADGWKAFIDGKEVPILKTNYLLRGIEIPNGKHKVEMKFDMPKYHSLNTLSMIGSVILLLLIAAGIYFNCIKAKPEATELGK